MSTSTPLPVRDMFHLLYKSVGVAEQAPIAAMRDAFEAKRYNEVIKLVRASLHLPIKVKTQLFMGASGRNSEDAVVRDFVSNEEAAGQVSFDMPVPRFGDPKFAEYRVRFFLKENRLLMSSERFVRTVAHEFCHILIRAVCPENHQLVLAPQKEHERAVDMVAMMLGFAEVFSHVERYKTRYEATEIGYLSTIEVEEILLLVQAKRLEHARDNILAPVKGLIPSKVLPVATRIASALAEARQAIKTAVNGVDF